MSHLNDGHIRRLYESGKLGIDPAPEDIQFQPASLDLRLGNEFFIFHRPLGKAENVQAIDPDEPFSDSWGERVRLSDGQSFLLFSGQFILATTVERVRIPHDTIARVEGRSSLGRLGLLIHATAGFVDPGFDGQITLEMANLNPRPIRLRPGMRICQLGFTYMTEVSDRPYGHPSLKSKYQGQMGVTPSRLHADQAHRAGNLGSEEVT